MSRATDGTLPVDLLENDRWLAWKETDDGRKVPRAPWRTGGDQFVSAQDPEVWTDVATARRWCEHLPGFELALNVRDRDAHDETLVLVDFDNVRDPESGRWHPSVPALIANAGSYAQISTSATGGHILCRGALPEGVKAIDASLPAHSDFPDAGIEVYDSGRFVAMTGRHIEGTPTETRDAQTFLDDLVERFATVAEGTPDELTREPAKSPGEIADVETTTDIQDVLDAIQHTGPEDIRLRSTVTNERSDGSKSLDPTWARSESGTRLAQVEDGWVYRKGMRGLDALQVVALEERIIASEDEYPSGEAFWKAIDALRERGAHVPEYDRSAASTGDDRGVAILPDSPIARAAANGWIWQQADRNGDSVTDARHRLYDRTTETIATAMDKRESAVVDAIMGGGKTYGYFAAGSDRDAPLAYFAPREELYEQAVEYAAENGISSRECYILPSINRDCPTFAGAHGDEWKARVRKLYDRGVTPKVIHSLLADEIPCKHEGKCGYELRCEFDPEDFEVLVGHHKHAHLTQVTKGRHCAFDEDPTNAFTTRIAGEALTRGINALLSFADSPPFDSFTDLLEGRHDPERREAGLEWFETGNGGTGFDFDPDERNAIDFEERGYHAYAPHAVYVILSAEPIEEGYPFERTTLPDMGEKPATGLFFRTDENEGEFFVELQTAPDLTYSNSVVALDGTPLVHPETDRPAEWDGALGRSMRHRQVLDDVERREYLRGQGYVFVQSSPFIRPYSSGRYNDAKRDAALLASVREQYGDGTPPTVFTSLTVEEEYRAGGFVDRGLASEIDHPGALRGSNTYADERLLVQLGSSHHGDHELRRRAAMLGEALDEPEDKGADRSYGDLGDAVLRQMREHQTAQNVLRVGRDGRGALVVLDTAAYPTYLPVEEGMNADVSLWSAGERQVHEAWGGLERDGKGVTTAELVDRPEVKIGTRQVHRVLDRLAAKGHLTRRDDPDDGRQVLWDDAGLGRIDVEDCAEIELPEVDMDAIRGVREERSGEEPPPFARRWEDSDISVLLVNTKNVATSEQQRGGSPAPPAPPATVSATPADHPDPPPDEGD